MSIDSTTRVAGPFTGNNVTVVFAFTFKVFAEEDLLVVITDDAGVDTTGVLGTDYSVVLNADQDADPGGEITYKQSGVAVALPTGYKLTATSALEELQPVVLTNLGGFFPAVINTALDRLTILIQQVSGALTRSIKIPVSTAGSAPVLAEYLDGKAIVYRSSDNSFVAGPDADEITLAQTYAESSKNWARKTDGQVESTDYSSKAYAIGGTGVSSVIGAAKEWAVTTGAAVISGMYSAKEWAVGTFTRGAAGGGSAKDWANYTGGTVDNAEYSSKYYASLAATSAAAAASSVAEGLYNDVTTLTAAGSPYTPSALQEGTLFRCDTSGGNIVINLSALSTYAEDMKFAFAKVTSDANTVTINRGGTNTINGATSTVINQVNQYRLVDLIGDSASGTWLASVSPLPEGIVIPSTAAGTTQTRFDNSTKIATTEYVHALGIVAQSQQVANGNYAFSDTQRGTIVVGVAAHTVSLPLANTAARSGKGCIMHAASGNITLSPSGGDTVTQTTIKQGDSAYVYPDGGTTWRVISLGTTQTLQTLGSSGYKYLGGGVIMQWKIGTATASIGGGGNVDQAITFPVSFPTSYMSAQTCLVGSPNLLNSPTIKSGTEAAGGLTVNISNSSGGSYSATPNVWALGYAS